MASSSSDRATSYSGSSQGWVPQQVTTPPQYLGRKTLPIKRGDAEPLTREDIQYDLLYFIFADPTKAFVDSMAPGQPLVNFCDLYVNALFNSSKCSKVLKDKMVDTPEFAIEFAKIALLTNVGRINTTMAFFHEMKTALRSYHPVPSLQKSNGNLQDAPRIKNCLKAALLPFEFKTPPPSTPTEILDKARNGQIPPTSVVNLIFVLSNATYAMQIAHQHFEPPVEFLDLFLPINLSSLSRAKAFLWIVFHYLSAPNSVNPFDDDWSRQRPGKVPRMISLSREDMARENQDPADEIEFGRRMSGLRSKFLKELVDEMEADNKRKRVAAVTPQPAPYPASGFSAPESSSGSRRIRSQRPPPSTTEGSRASSYGHDYVAQYQPPPIQQPLPLLAPAPQPSGPGVPEGLPAERTMVEHAWHVANTVDPLEDSDKEADEHVRSDYNRRLRVISRLRGKEPTPPPTEQPSAAAASTPAHYQMQSQFHTSQQSAPSASSSEPKGKLRQVTWE
ncbi:hypothetical protein BDW22DRAFT_1350940 [Trametopsis cervina]|nr:hypothetical protein BDW22DRAFT_1350940 [Trametopsis cervina]